MKLFSLSVLLAAAASAACAAVETIPLFDNTAHTTSAPAKILAVKALSTVADGTATVKSESVVMRYRDLVITNAVTNLTYTLVYTNGSQTITNTVANRAELLPLPPSRLSFVTNASVTATVKTNAQLYAAMTVTNTHASVTCASGIGSAEPSDAFVGGGDRVWFDGTAKGRVLIFVDK